MPRQKLNLLQLPALRAAQLRRRAPKIMRRQLADPVRSDGGFHRRTPQLGGGVSLRASLFPFNHSPEVHRDE